MSTSRSADDHEDSNREEWNKDCPFHPDRLTLMNEQLWEQVNDGDPQAVDGMEEYTEEDENLKQPVLVDCIEKDTDLTAQERCQDMHSDKNCHAYAADAVQDKGQHGTLASVTQASRQADVSVQAHLRLLENLVLESIIPFSFLLLKVTILMGYWFQISSNKERIDLYNP
jgi:hypothetical protein